MKITCSSCGSKYTIADAKVKGKKVKVRCKSCKESILVDGTQVSGDGSDDDADDDTGALPQASLAPSPADPAKVDPNLWSVNLSDDDSREMTLAQLVAGWKDGTVTSDAYVWKDGMGDWKPILEVGELKTKLGPAQPRVAPPPTAKPTAKAKIAGDLFGSLESSAGPGGLGGPKPAETKATGARNDSSVLFSLDSLTSPTAAGGSGNVSANVFGDLGTTAGPLTNDTDLLMAPPKEPPPAPIGARAAVTRSIAPEKKGKGLVIGAVVGALLLVGGVVFALGGNDGEAEKLAAVEAEKAKMTAEAEKAKAELEAAQAKMNAEKEKLKADLEKAKQEVAEEKKDDKLEAAKKKEEEEEAAAKAKAEEAKQAAASTSSKPASSSSSAAPASPKPAASGGEFNVAAAKAALNTAAANAAACGKQGGPKGTGKVQVTFSTSGRVTSANVVSGPFGGTSVGGCVASTFRRASVPPFSGSPTTVAKSFTIN